MAEDPGGPGRPLAAKRQQWQGAACRLQWLKAEREAPSRAAWEAKVRTGSEIAERGCRKAAHLHMHGCQVGTRVPFF